jgi:sugar transferase (PEP-CTERM system associated)
MASMIRLFNVYFPGRTILLALTEAVLIVALFLLVCFGSEVTQEAAVSTPGDAILRMIVATAVLMLCMYYYDLYDTSIIQSPIEVVPRLIQVLGTTCLVLALLYHLYPVAQLSKRPFVLWILMVGVALGAWRRFFALINGMPRLRQRVLLVGDGQGARALTAEVMQRPQLGMQLIGYLGEGDGDAVPGLHCVGRLEDLSEVVEQNRVSRVILTMPEQQGSLPVEELLRMKSEGIIIQNGDDIFEAITGRVMLGALRPGWLLFGDGFQVSHFLLASKRAISIAISVVGLLLSFPFMLLAAIAIKLDSPGPVIFRQERVGKQGRTFTLFKFRSMTVNADSDGVVRPAQRNDNRVTRVGRWLRKLRIDELPQLYNILRGDMYFIGPRPFTPNLEQGLAKEIPFYCHRWLVKPGATGWAQVRRGYNETLNDNIEKLSYDLFYIKNMSIGLDFLILFETAKIIILGRGGR